MVTQRLLRVGHKGAGLIAPGNTYASFDAALAAGVDMIEFDVLPERPDDSRAGRRLRRRAGRADTCERLLLAHDYVDVAGRSPHTLQEGLGHLASEAFSGVEFDVDLKLPGYELRVLEALRAHDLLDRALISSQYLSSLETIRAAEPGVRLGWSVPKLRRDPFRWPILKPPALALMHLGRAILPGRAGRAIRAGRCDALMVHWLLVTPRLVREVRGAGGQLYVWTVDELARLRQLEALGVTGVITNDPRLFEDAGA
ncbi:MAG: glycerophosphodiester phosphodiesterase [Solirubrobacteraceae bacterium]